MDTAKENEILKQRQKEVVDMIKNLVTNLEEFGYKLKLTEDETNEIYNIKIEVEK